MSLKDGRAMSPLSENGPNENSSNGQLTAEEYLKLLADVEKDNYQRSKLRLRYNPL
jgi:hypothetical protein